MIPTHAPECTHILQHCTQSIGKVSSLQIFVLMQSQPNGCINVNWPSYGAGLQLFMVWFGAPCRFKIIASYSKFHTRVCLLFISTGKLCNIKCIVKGRLCLAKPTWSWNLRNTGMMWMLVIWREMRFIGKVYLHKNTSSDNSELHHNSFLRTVLKCNVSHPLMALSVTCTAEPHKLVNWIVWWASSQLQKKGSDQLFTTPRQRI